MVKYIVFLVLFLISPMAKSESSTAGPSSRTGFEIYAAAGMLLGPGSLRFGGADWEGGILSPYMLGFDKVIRFGQYYSAFGFGFVLSNDADLGFYGGVGWESDLFWGLIFRGELNSVVAPSGHSGASALAGVSVFL